MREGDREREISVVASRLGPLLLCTDIRPCVDPTGESAASVVLV